MRRTLVLLSLVLFGMTSLIMQLLMMAELIISFYEFELFLSIVLAVWLVSVGLGSLLGAFWIRRCSVGDRGLPWLHCIMAVTMPVMIFGARMIQSHHWGGRAWLTMAEILYWTVLLQAPACFCIGMHFALCARLASRHILGHEKGYAGVYVAEGLGSLLGGVVFSFVLLPCFQPFQIVWFLTCLQLVYALVLLIRLDPQNKTLAVFSAGLLCLVAAGMLGGIARVMDIHTTRMRWREDYDVVFQKLTKYGDVEVLRDKEDRSLNLLVNRMVMFGETTDKIHNESLVHFSLLEHPNPKTVLLIGAGAGGALREVLKHPVDKVVLLEINPLVMDVAEGFFPHVIAGAGRDKRVRIVHTDGRRFVKRSAEHFDVIMVDFADPYVSQMARFYSMDFFRESRRILSRDGILTVQCFPPGKRIVPHRGSWSGVGGGIKDVSRCVYQSMHEVFPDVLVIPGHYDFFLGFQSGGQSTIDVWTLTKRLLARRVASRVLVTGYLSRLFHPGHRMEQLSYLHDGQPVHVSTDLRPLISQYDLTYWRERWYGGMRFITAAAERLSLAWFALPAALLGGMLMIVRGGTACRRRLPITLHYLIFTTGFVSLWIECLLLWMIATHYGYLLPMIGLQICAFMAGLVAGSLLIRTLIDRGLDPGRLLMTMEVMFCLSLLLVLFLAMWTTGNLFSHGALAEFPVLFLLMMAVTGMLGGGQFVAAANLYHTRRGGEASGQSAGVLYCFDLLGAGVAGFVVSPIGIPSLGVVNCFLAAILLKAGSTFLFFARPSTSSASVMKAVRYTVPSLCAIATLAILLLSTGRFGSCAAPRYPGRTRHEAGHPAPRTPLDSARLGGEWLIRNQRADGKFPYVVDLVDPKYGVAYSLRSHMGATLALLSLYDRTRDAKFLHAAEKAILFYRRHLVSRDQMLQSVYGVHTEMLFPVLHDVTEGDSIPYAILAMLQHHKISGKHADMDIAKKLGRFLLFLHAEDGGLKPRGMMDPADPSDASVPVHEALYAWMHLYQHTGDEKWLRASVKLADSAQFLVDDGCAFALDGLHALYEETQSPKYLERYRLALESRVRARAGQHRFHRDVRGAAYGANPGATIPASLSGTALYALCAMRQDDPAGDSRCRKALVQTGGFLQRMQIPPDDRKVLSDPDRCIGAFREGISSVAVSLDASYHGILFMLFLDAWMAPDESHA